MKFLWCIAGSFLSLSLQAQTPAPEASPAGAASAQPATAPAASAAPDAAKAVPGPGTTQVTLPDCASYSATPLDAPILLRGNTVYFSSPKLASDTGAATSYLIEAHLAEGKAKRVAGFKSGETVSLLAHDNEGKAITILDFTAGEPDCGEGVTTGTAIRPSEQKVLPSYASGFYGLVPGESQANLADLNKGLIQLVDLKTSQKRTLQSFAAGSRPQYLKVSPPVALYNYFPKTRELSKFVANKKTPDATLKLKEGMRLVRSGDRFGIAQAKGAQLQILQLKDWSGPETKSVSLDLPPGFAVDSTAVKADFAADEYVLMGKDERSKKNLRTVVYFADKSRKIFKAPDEKSYFSAAERTPEGSLIMLLSELDSNVVRELWVDSGNAEPRKIDVLKAKKAAPAKK